MTRTEKFMRNVAAFGFLQVLMMGYGLVVPRLMLEYYGSEINGLVSSIMQFMSYFNIVEAGLGSAAVFALYKPLADNDNQRISNIVTAAKEMYYTAGKIFLGLVVALSILYPMYISVSNMGYWQVLTLVFILGLTGITNLFVLAKYTALLTANQRLYIISIADGVRVILSTVFIYLLAKYDTNIIFLYLVIAIIMALKATIVVWYARTRYKEIDYSSKTPEYEALNKRWSVIYLQGLNMIQNGTPVILLTLFVKDLKVVSVYVVYNIVIHGIRSVLEIFRNGLHTGFGELLAKGELKRFQEAYTDFEFAYYNMIGIVYAVSFVMIQPFINIYTSEITDTNYNLPYIGFLFVLNAFLYIIKTPQGMLVHAAGLYKETRVQTTVQGAIGLILGCILVYDYGIEGVLFGAIASNIYRDIELPYFMAKNVTKLNFINTYRMEIYVCILMCISAYISNKFVYESTSYIDWLVNGSVALLITSMLFLLADSCIYRSMLLRLILRLRAKTMKKV